MTSTRRTDTATAIVHHHGKVLVVLKSGWDRFDIPMTKLRIDAGETGAQAAARCIQEELGTSTVTEPGLLLDAELLQSSLRTGETGHYQVQVYCHVSSSETLANEVIGKWLTPDEILDPADGEISPTARELIGRLQEAALFGGQKGGRSFPPLQSPITRSSTASVAIVRREGSNGPEWLAQWNSAWGRYFLVGGHEEANETTTDCILREVKEELNVDPHEVRIQEGQTLRYSSWSVRSWQPTNYVITAFPVQFPDDVLSRIIARAENRWLTAEEIRRERCRDDKLVSPTMRHVLAEMGELSE